MRPPSPPPADGHRRAWMRLAALALALACRLTETARYSPEQDDAAMAIVASAWSEPGGTLALSLCEDRDASAAWTGPDGCGIDHVVRGGGLGMRHEVSHEEGGCTSGGCRHDAIAYVRGAISGAWLAGEVPLVGRVTLAGSTEADPYAFPWRVRVACDDPQGVQRCAVVGTLDATGRLSVTLVQGDPAVIGNPETAHALDRVADAACAP